MEERIKINKENLQLSYEHYKKRKEIKIILEKIEKEIGNIVKYGVERDILTGEDEVIVVLFVLPQERENKRKSRRITFKRKVFHCCFFNRNTKIC